MKFKSEEFSKNFKFLSALFLIVIFSLLISLLFNNGSNNFINSVELTDEFDSKVSKLVINEVCSSNGGVIVAEGETYDWIELYNGSKNDINLKNYGLSDTSDKIKWVFPETVIKSKSYLVVFLSGVKKNALFANFALSSGGGEVLSLRKPNGKIIDAFETKRIDKNSSFIRDASGEWNKTTTPTPGYENSTLGYKEYHDSLLAANADLKITEVLPVNKGNFMDKYGFLSSYIEVKNISDKTVNLSLYYLSDEESVPFKWNMPDKSLGKGDTILVFTGSDIEDEYYADFKLNSQNGHAILSKNDNTIIDKVKYEDLTNGYALVWQDDDFYATANISPGFENNAEGSGKYSSVYQNASKDLIINEAMTSNSKYLVQNGYNFYDWVEIKNNSSDTINLSDYHLSKDATDKEGWRLPEVSLKSGEYYVLMASGDEKLSNDTYRHANFKLSDDDGLFLFKEKKMIDSVFLYKIPVNYSYGRGDKDGFYYMSPTPKAKNNAGSKEISYTPEVKTLPGVFNNVNEVKVSFKYPGRLYYTTDGSNPTTSSSLYTNEIVLTKTSIIKAIAVEEGKLPSEVSVGSYIINENHTLPVLSLSLNNTDFNRVTKDAWNTEIEVGAHTEFFENGGGFSIPCGFKLFGGATRGLPKQSYLLKFKKTYGDSELHYKVFDTRNASVYNSLVIRSGSQDYARTMIRDEVASSVVDGLTNLDVQANKAIILYVNAKYYGVYFLREKVDEEFVANHYNVNPNGTSVFRVDGDVTVGSKKEYISLLSYVNTHDMTRKESYEYMTARIDIDSVIDFWIAETWVTNNDIINTRFFSNPDIENGKFNMIFYDLDYAFYNVSRDYFKFFTSPNGMVSNPAKPSIDNTIIRGLMKNASFKARFVERLEYNLKNVWTKKRVNDKITLLYNTIAPEMERNQSRWGLTMATWNSRLNELRDYVDKREGYLKDQIKSFFSLSEKKVNDMFGG